MALADPALVFVKGDVEHPVTLVLDAPVLADHLLQPFGVGLMGGQVVALLHALLAVHALLAAAELLAMGFDADHRAQTRPVFLLQFVDPPETIGGQHHASLDSPMGLVVHLGGAEGSALLLAVLEVSRAAEKLLRPLVKSTVIGFESQQVIGMGHGEFTGDGFLATHGIETHGVAFEVELVNELGHGGDLVGLPVDGELTEGQLVVDGPCADKMQARGGVCVLEAVPQGLAVDGDELAVERPADREDKRGKALAEPIWINGSEDTPEGVIAGYSARQLEAFAQPRLTGFGEALEVIEPLASTDHRRQGDENDLAEVVARMTTIAWIFQTLEGLKSIWKAA